MACCFTDPFDVCVRNSGNQEKKNASCWTLWSYTTDFPHEETCDRVTDNQSHAARPHITMREELPLEWGIANDPTYHLAFGLPTSPVSRSVKLGTESFTDLLGRLNVITHVKYFLWIPKGLCGCHELLFGAFISQKKKKQGRKIESDLWINKQ